MVLVPSISQWFNSQFSLGSNKASDLWETAGSSGWLLKYSFRYIMYIGITATTLTLAEGAGECEQYPL